MKIKFLGSSAGWPLPRLGCKCELCSSTDPRDTRTRTQILIDDKVLLDVGPDTYQHLINLDSIASSSQNSTPLQNDKKEGIADTLKAILVSHEHPDHILGFQDITHIYNFRNQVSLYITQPVLRGIKRIFPFPLNPLKVKVVKPNETFTVDSARVQYFPVIHGKTPAFGIKYKDGKFLAYIPDFNKILPSQEKVIRDAHLLIIDGSSLGKIGQGPGHISITDGIQIAKKLKVKQTYFVHIGHKTGRHEFLENYLKENAGPNFHIAFDNQKIIL